MKKIFAIALALVMVLSMASAMAYCVTDINWNCNTDVCNNGTGKIEIVPVVKTNDGCYSFNWTNNTCAGAVNSEKVYFAVKLTVDAYPNAEWWEKAKIEFSTKGLDTKAANVWFPADGPIPAAVVDTDSAKAVEYYLTNGAWTKASDLKDGLTDAYVWSALVTNASKAKVCVTLKSANNFKVATINGYTVTLEPDAVNILQIAKDGKTVQVETDKDDKIVAFKVNVGTGWETIKTYNVGKTAFYAMSNNTYNWTCDELGKFLKEVMDAFKLDFGTCITKKAVKANFGWDNEIESCFAWSANASAIVDPDCKIEIPKTGDVSVVAYAVLALVAAAGAMGLKK